MIRHTVTDITPFNVTERARRLRAALEASLSEEELVALEAAEERLLRSGLTRRARKEGERAIDFCLPEARGGYVRLSETLARGPVVLSFFRGGWCPFCGLELKALRARLLEVQAAGATVLAISPELLGHALATAVGHDLQFPVLSDQGNEVARAYGLVQRLDEALRPIYRRWGIDLPDLNGDESYELPVPTTYVIDVEGVIRSAHFDHDATRLTDAADTLAALRSLRH